MIPKIIHYCWFGGKSLPKSALKCIDSWRRFFPDYEIKEWNEGNFDVNAIQYTKEAYEEKKYAFVSDYARFKILYEHGGVYFDTDVEVIKSFDDILAAGSFMGLEQDPCAEVQSTGRINPGLGLAAPPGLDLYKDVIDKYASLRFRNSDGSLCLTTVVSYVTELLLEKGLNPYPGIMEVGGVRIYPVEYFNPKLPNGKIVITTNTHSIHHYTASWYSPKQHIVMWVINHIGLWPGRVVSIIFKNPVKIVPRIWRFIRDGK